VRFSPHQKKVEKSRVGWGIEIIIYLVCPLQEHCPLLALLDQPTEKLKDGGLSSKQFDFEPCYNYQIIKCEFTLTNIRKVGWVGRLKYAFNWFVHCKSIVPHWHY
jgi:hypothetical protein